MEGNGKGKGNVNRLREIEHTRSTQSTFRLGINLFRINSCIAPQILGAHCPSLELNKKELKKF